MAKHDSAIIEDFCKGVKISPYRWNFTASGQRIFGYDWLVGVKETEVFRLTSYNMDLAYRFRWRKQKYIALNGDGAPSATINKHQILVRKIVYKLQKEVNVGVCIVPFSALASAGIPDPWQIGIVDITPDCTMYVEKRCTLGKACPGDGNWIDGKQHRHSRLEHFLGETLFKSGGRYYVCGLDRNDDVRLRNFYLTRLASLPRMPTTVERALASLRPKGLRDDTLRQGEWFLEPAPKLEKPHHDLILRSTCFELNHTHRNIRGVPILSESAAAQEALFRDDDDLRRERVMRHRASAMFLEEKHDLVYVRGTLYDAQHGRLKLGDGKTWHRVVRNLADGSWRSGGPGAIYGKVD